MGSVSDDKHNLCKQAHVQPCLFRVFGGRRFNAWEESSERNINSVSAYSLDDGMPSKQPQSEQIRHFNARVLHTSHSSPNFPTKTD